MTEAVDPEAAGLLDGLTGDARTQRAELIPWLVEQGITVEEIRGGAVAPMLLPGRRIFGDDGTRLSARQISEQTGLDLDQLRRFQRASGLSTVDDPDAAVFLKPDAESAVHIKRFLDLGFDPDRLLTVVRVLQKDFRTQRRRCATPRWPRRCNTRAPLNSRWPRVLRCWSAPPNR